MTPSFQSHIIKSHPTGVITASKTPVQQEIFPPGPDSLLWQNVEYHRYGNNPLESHFYKIPASYSISQYPNIIHDGTGIKIVQ